MQSSIIRVEHLSKHYKVPIREAGLKAATRSLFKRSYKSIKAVDDISFQIEPGEVVGFPGPNGAGKTTTLKMLSGLLFPTGGTAQVLGYQPSRRQAEFLQQITLVMGNRSQLAWDLPAQALTNRLTPTTLPGALVLTIFFLILSRFIWKLGVRGYSGASA